MKINRDGTELYIKLKLYLKLYMNIHKMEEGEGEDFYKKYQ